MGKRLSFHQGPVLFLTRLLTAERMFVPLKGRLTCETPLRDAAELLVELRMSGAGTAIDLHYT